jgi:hypothetical protein
VTAAIEQQQLIDRSASWKQGTIREKKIWESHLSAMIANE